MAQELANGRQVAGGLPGGLDDIPVQRRQIHGGGDAQLFIEDAVHLLILLQRLLGLARAHQGPDQVVVEKLLVAVDGDGPFAQGDHIHPPLPGHQQIHSGLDQMDIHGVVVGCFGCHPVFAAGPAQKIALVQFHRSQAGFQPLVRGDPGGGGLLAGHLKEVHIQFHGQFRIPGVAAAGGENDIPAVGVPQGIQHGAGPVHQGFQGAGGVNALSLGVHQFHQFLLRDLPVAEGDEIGQQGPGLP